MDTKTKTIRYYSHSDYHVCPSFIYSLYPYKNVQTKKHYRAQTNLCINNGLVLDDSKEHKNILMSAIEPQVQICTAVKFQFETFVYRQPHTELTDASTKQKIRQQIMPEFRNTKYNSWERKKWVNQSSCYLQLWLSHCCHPMQVMQLMGCL